MDWQSRLPAIGTLKASQGIDLSVEIAGTITDVQFQSGEKVSKGQAIVLLDSEMEQASRSAPRRTSARPAWSSSAPAACWIAGPSPAANTTVSMPSRRRPRPASPSCVPARRRSASSRPSPAPSESAVDVGDYIAAGTPIATLQDLSTLYVDFFRPNSTYRCWRSGRRCNCAWRPTRTSGSKA